MPKKPTEEIVENIVTSEYSEIMQKSYIDYAMSVIVARALPDVRDGLKPVQRRTLYDMYELGIKHDGPYRKCARIVGDTMGKYHPHGDSSIYDALVVMSQDFKKGMPLVDGHGNFGSIEGDGAAAMRYTEARLKKITQEAYLADLDKDVVDFMPNFDETEKEPVVLPVRVPNLLINGAEGIAVGMATSIPPHNVGEVIDAVCAYIKNNDITTEELLNIIPGPDFPTGGIVTNKDEILSIYESGVGKIKIRGKVEVEEVKGGKQRLVITEIPYTMIGAGIGKFLNDIADLIESHKTNDIVDILNQSGKEGIRIVLELKKGADIKNLENMLYKKTRLEDTFGVNMLSIADGRPETMGIKKIIEHNVDFQFELNNRKYSNLLKKEQAKREIQEGLIAACDCIDLIIEILRGSKNVKDAKACLVSGETKGIKFKVASHKADAAKLRFSENQADAILQMRLYKLIGLEIDALNKEHKETLEKIARYENLLNNYDAMAEQILSDLQGYKKEYSSPRKTLIENGVEAVYEEKKVEEMDVVVLMDRFNYVRYVDVPTFERNKEAAVNENRFIIACKNTDRLVVFSENGNMHTIKVLSLPFGKFRDKGIPLDNVSNFDTAKEQIIFASSVATIATQNLLFTTIYGQMKLVEGVEFDVAKKLVAATKLNDGDKLLDITVLQKQHNVTLQSHDGYFLRFSADEIPFKKKSAVGVRGMKLMGEDYIENIYFTAYTDDAEIEYKGKKFSINSRVKLYKRDSKGTKIRI